MGVPLGSDHCTHCPGSHTGARPCLASASVKSGSWLLIEHAGPWADRLDDTSMLDPVRQALGRAREHSVRIQLIRRPGRRRSIPPVQVYAARSGANAWLEGRVLADPAELNELDLKAVGAGVRPGFGTPVHHLFLVCTNGKHNTCCARLGGPLARTLQDGFGEAVWETTHLGGDQYSANMVCLPHGLYYGDLAHVDGLVAAGRYLRGEVWLKRYRGRGGLPQPAQAAEHFLRVHTGVLSVTAVSVESVTDGPVAEVIAGLDGERYLIRVERVPVDPCGPDCTSDASTYALTDLTLLRETATRRHALPGRSWQPH
jgi:hypothetical protein